jgi:hypothetical protein
VKQVGKHLRQAHGIAVDVDRLRRNIDAQMLLALVDERPVGFDRLFQELADRDRASLQRDLPAGHARHLQQVVEKTGHVPDLAFDDPVDLLQVGFRGRDQAQDRVGGANRRQRIAQLMGECGEKLLLPQVRPRGGIGQRLGVERGQNQMLICLAQLSDAPFEGIDFLLDFSRVQAIRLFPKRPQLPEQARGILGGSVRTAFVVRGISTDHPDPA